MGRSAIRPLVGALLGATLLASTACGADRSGSVAIGGAPPAPVATTPSRSGVVFVPLDPPTSGSTTGGTPTGTQGGPGSTTPSTAPGTTPGAATGRPSSPTGAGNAGAPSGGTSGASGGTGSTGTTGSGTGSGTPTPGGGPTSSPPRSPASLAVTALHTADTGRRWCQLVTLGLANSGDLAATSGTVTFATHVIGALGVDWWTYQTSQALAAPVAGHSSVSESWTVCLDSWRVPAGMHMETRAASLG